VTKKKACSGIRRKSAITCGGRWRLAEEAQNRRRRNGVAVVIGVEIVKDQKTREYAPQERDRIVELAFDRAFFCWVAVRAQFASRRRWSLRDEADVAIDVLEESITIVEKNA